MALQLLLVQRLRGAVHDVGSAEPWQALVPVDLRLVDGLRQHLREEALEQTLVHRRKVVRQVTAHLEIAISASQYVSQQQPTATQRHNKNNNNNTNTNIRPSVDTRCHDTTVSVKSQCHDT